MSRSSDLTNQALTHVVVLVLENHQGDVLLTQRKADTHLARYWEFPGGKIEPKESKSHALERECTEEIGYTPTSPLEILNIDYNYETVNVRIYVFHETVKKPSVKALEKQNMQWVSKKKLHTHQLPAANQVIVDYLNQI